MLKDITLGQYYPTESPIHKLDPRVKLFGTLVFIVSLFLAKILLSIVLPQLFFLPVYIYQKCL